MSARFTFDAPFVIGAHIEARANHPEVAERVFLRHGDRSWTYEAVARKSRKMAGLLAAHGVRRGERVLIVLPDAPPFAWSFFGTLTRGAVVAMGNPHAPIESLEYLSTLLKTLDRNKAAPKLPPKAQPPAPAAKPRL